MTDSANPWEPRAYSTCLARMLPGGYFAVICVTLGSLFLLLKPHSYHPLVLMSQEAQLLEGALKPYTQCGTRDQPKAIVPATPLAKSRRVPGAQGPQEKLEFGTQAHEEEKGQSGQLPSNRSPPSWLAIGRDSRKEDHRPFPSNRAGLASEAAPPA